MMTAQAYLLFRNKIDPIIRGCTVVPGMQYRLPQGDLAVYRGQSSFTRGKSYQFSTSRARSYQKEMLMICRDLPKMDAVLPGTACTISSLALIKRVPNQAMLAPQIEAAEQFFVLLTLADIGSYRVFKSRTGITYLNMNIIRDYKDIVAP